MNNARKTFWMGIAFTLVGAAFWGVSGTSVQYLTTQTGATPALVTLLRAIFGGGLFMAYLLWRRPTVVRQMFGSWRAFAPVLLFAFGLYASQFSYAQAVMLTNAGTATVLQMLGSVFVMAYVCLTERHWPRKREFCGLIIAVMATLLIACQGDIRTLNLSVEGLVWGLITSVAAAGYILLPKELGLFDRYGAVATTGGGIAASTVFALPGYLLQSGGGADFATVLGGFDGLAWFVLLGGTVVAGIIGGYGLYLKGVSIVGSVKGALLGAVEPVSAMVIAAVWLSTPFTSYDVAGLILMCVMVACITGRENPATDR